MFYWGTNYITSDPSFRAYKMDPLPTTDFVLSTVSTYDTNQDYAFIGAQLEGCPTLILFLKHVDTASFEGHRLSTSDCLNAKIDQIWTYEATMRAVAVARDANGDSDSSGVFFHFKQAYDDDSCGDTIIATKVEVTSFAHKIEPFHLKASIDESYTNMAVLMFNDLSNPNQFTHVGQLHIQDNSFSCSTSTFSQSANEWKIIEIQRPTDLS